MCTITMFNNVAYISATNLPLSIFFLQKATSQNYEIYTKKNLWISKTTVTFFIFYHQNLSLTICIYLGIYYKHMTKQEPSII